MRAKKNRGERYVDKIMRKNLECPGPDLLSFFISGRIAKVAPLPPRTSQMIIEQEPDTLLLIETQDQKSFIFHLEFQSTNDHRMADRMASYHYMLRLKHKTEIVSVVIYTGNERLTMKNFIRDGKNYYEYRLIDIRDMDPELFLRSENAAEVMLAILTGRDEDNKASLIRKILKKLQEMLAESRSLLDEQIGIFKILGSIRGDNIQQQIIKEEHNMPILYDINKVFFYKEAMAKGRMEGKEEGREEGKEQGRKEVIESIIAKMISANMPLSTIQAITNIPIEKIRKLGNIPDPEN
ncbi:MAG: Rpn family recombination-promoting nuclease/putative transposase [Chitinophagaceae bacterium]|nr:Rpn family recombination-promoting nuclease/putative transposase [Chitinophagaceae bacterium]